MPIPRYERELDEAGGPRFATFYLRLIAIAAIIGLVIGVVWVVAGLLHFHVLR